MKALVLEAIKTPLKYKDLPEPEPESDEVLVQLKAAALNRRDYFITQGLYPNIKLPIILGSDGAGTHEGREVIINPNIKWGDDPAFQSKEYRILGLPKDGTFAEAVAVERRKLADKPSHLTWEQAAALPLAGMTAYRALFTKGGLKAGHHVLITGVGGGVAQFALQFAVAAGASVFVTSGSKEKIAKAMELGAEGGANYREEGWDKKLAEQATGFDIIIDSAGGEGFPPLLKLCYPGARIVIYGGTLGKISHVSPQIIFWKQLSILGSTMATDEEFHAMVKFVNQHQIVPAVDSVFPLADGNQAIEKIAKSEQFGKVVLSIP